MLSLARQGQAYTIEEVTQGVTPALAAANAVRHKTITMPFDNKNRRTILEKKQSPGHITAARTDQRKTAAGNYEGILRPSGTINTVPEVAPMLKAGFGSVVNTTLSTTVSVGTGVVGGATLASVAGLVVGSPLLITCPDTKKRIRFVATLPGGAAVTWVPNLPAGQAPADGAAVKCGILYKLTTLLALTLSLAHYHKKTDGTAGLKRVLSMWGIDKLSILFDANDDPMIKASGAGKAVDDAAAQPGGFTTVGGQPPSGITSELLVGNTAMKYLKLALDISNGLWWRNEDAGDSAATEMFRKDRRQVQLSIDSRAETEATLYDLAEAGTNAAVFGQVGFTEGSAIAFRAPQVEFKVPDTDDPDDLVNWNFKGEALESADDANDEAVLALC